MRTLVCFLGTLLLGASNLAAAQDVPPDAVILHDGGFVRGTILEHVPDDHVTIRLVDGSTRTIDAAEVREVRTSLDGSVERAPEVAEPEREPDVPFTEPVPTEHIAPPAPRPRETPAETALHVRVENEDGEGTMVSYSTESLSVAGDGYTVDVWSRACRAPCDTGIPRGTQWLGFSQGTEAVRRGVRLTGGYRDLSITIETSSRATERLVGALMIAGGLVLGAVFLGGFAAARDANDRDAGFVFGTLSAASAGLGLLVGIPLTLLWDHRGMRIEHGL